MTFEDLKRQSVFEKTIVLSDAWRSIGDMTEEDRRLAELHEGLTVTFREPSMAEMGSLRKIQGDEQIEMAMKLMPVHLVRSDLKKADGVDLTAKEVVEYIASSSNLFSYVLTQWIESLPLTRRSVKRSETSGAS